MSRFLLILSKTAVHDLDRLNDNTAQTILEASQILEENPFPRGNLIKKIKGTKSTFYRLRVGDYRVFYFIDKGRVVIVKVVARKDAEKFIKNL